MKELVVPTGVLEHDDGVEFVRMWVAGGEDHVSLNIGAMGDREVVQWGMILADISIHIIRGLVQDGATESPEILRAELEKAYLGRLKNKDADYSGCLLGSRH